MIGNQKTENIMLLVNAYNNEPSVGNYNAVYGAIDNALSRHPAPTDRQEAVAELAHKKGFSSIAFQRDWECKDLGIKDGVWHYSLYMHQSHLGGKPMSKGFPTYKAAEDNARQYLEALPDSEKRGRV